MVTIYHCACTAVRSYHFKAFLWLNKTKREDRDYLLVGWFDKVADVTFGRRMDTVTGNFLSANLVFLFLVSLKESLSVNTLGSKFCNYNKAEYK